MPNARLRRRAAGALAAFALAVLVLAAQGGRIYEKVLDLRYGTPLPAPHGAAPRDAKDARLQDLQMLAALPTVDRSFGAQARARFEQEVADLRARAASLDDAAFFLGVAQAVALSANAHTNVDLVSWREKLAALPVRLAWFPEGLYVIRARGEGRALLGARVLAIDGHAPETLEREASRYFAGTREYLRSVSHVALESPAVLHALHPDAPADRALLTVRDAAAVEREVTLEALAPSQAPRAVKPGRLRSPVPLEDEAPGTWQALLDARPIPPSLRGPEHVTYSTTLDEGRTLYLHLWQVRDEPHEAIAGRIERALGAGQWQRIVLDLRFDAGGDYPTVYGAMRDLARHLAPAGRLAILTDETTFSAAIITAVLAKHFAGVRAIVVGSPPGDRLEFWAEGTPATLPNSRIRIGVSTGYHDWAHGCRKLACWWPNFYYDVAGGDLAPQIPVRWTFADYARGVDTVLERALR